ncbi:MAG: type I 3-dehydroquinate dehydratase [Deltaproteobacteria bacterium]|nr:MAG: type I 3-dehydroquinate dehydratase [Deltaproteobacteria bacterium]
MGRPPAIGAVQLSTGTPRVVAAGGEAELDALTTAAGADVVELRADLFEDPRPETVTAALVRLRAAGRPIILTVRAAAEGGRPLDEARRHALYTAGLLHVDAVDLEIASGALVAEVAPRARATGRTVILSAHAFDAMPPEDALRAAIERAAELGADLTKIAALAGDAEELRRLLAVTLAARDRHVVTLAMGPMGPLSRLVLPAAGSLLTYGHVGRPTAPGQLGVAELAAELRRLYPS